MDYEDPVGRNGVVSFEIDPCEMSFQLTNEDWILEVTGKTLQLNVAAPSPLAGSACHARPSVDGENDSGVKSGYAVESRSQMVRFLLGQFTASRGGHVYRFRPLGFVSKNV